MGEPNNSNSFLPGKSFNVNAPIKGLPHASTPCGQCRKVGGDLTFLKGDFPYCGTKFSD